MPMIFGYVLDVYKGLKTVKGYLKELPWCLTASSTKKTFQRFQSYWLDN